MKKKINIEVEMEERWVSCFCSMLKEMEYCGEIGHSSIIGFYSDGDGDFRPKFSFSESFNIVNGYKENLPKLEILYDAE